MVILSLSCSVGDFIDLMITMIT